MLGTCYAEFAQWYKSSEGRAKQTNMRAKLGLNVDVSRLFQDIWTEAKPAFSLWLRRFSIVQDRSQEFLYNLLLRQ